MLSLKTRRNKRDMIILDIDQISMIVGFDENSATVFVDGNPVDVWHTPAQIMGMIEEIKNEKSRKMGEEIAEAIKSSFEAQMSAGGFPGDDGAEIEVQAIRLPAGALDPGGMPDLGEVLKQAMKHPDEPADPDNPSADPDPDTKH